MSYSENYRLDSGIAIVGMAGRFPGANNVRDLWRNILDRRETISRFKPDELEPSNHHEMVQRTGVPDLSTFVASIIQADQLGVSIAKVLRIQSEQMRIRRRQRAEEQAHKAPILMMIPMVFLIFPATYIVILGPAVPKMLAAFGG